MRRVFLAWFFVALVNSFTFGQERPNIVYIMADELGYYELSCMGNPHIRTPNIDRLAAEGIRFTQALAGSSVCAPTRCCLMTGKHSGHTSVRTNGGGTPLRADEVTIASLLKGAGYATGGFGKWGCGGRGSTGVPENHGFDVFFGYYDQVHAHSYYPPYLIRNSAEIPLDGNQGGSQGDTYSHYEIFNAGLAFIRDHQDEPFFCYLPVTPPHGLFDIPDSDPAWGWYRDKSWPEPAKRYAAMASMVDRQVGQVLEQLRELGLEQRTIVFFCGDNGGNDYFRSEDFPRGFHGANVNPVTGVEFRGTKGTLYEGGLRIPMVVRWPGHIEPGQVSDLLWYFPDVFPTLAELAQVDAPKEIDGISIVPTLLGTSTQDHPQQQHEYLYWELNGQSAVRMANWKAVKPRGRSSWELYDLEHDLSERHNIAEQHNEILAKMTMFATQAHEPVEEGTFRDRELHERDRRAKFGGSRPSSSSARPVNTIPTTGLLPNASWKVVRVSSESKANNKLARHAIDGDARTHWHTAFQPQVERHPHELIIDLGRTATIHGVRYLARQDAGWNGTIAECDWTVSNSLNSFGEPMVRTTLKKVKTAQQVEWEPVNGRYLRLRIHSEVNDGPWASCAELGILGKWPTP